MRNYYKNYRKRNLTAPEASGTLQNAIEQVSATYKELGPNQEIVEVGGVKVGDSANPNVNGTVAVAMGTQAPRNFKVKISTSGATTPKTAILFDAHGTHGGDCSCYPDVGSSDLATISNIGCNNYAALVKLTGLKNLHLDTVRIQITDVSSTPVVQSASTYQIDVSRKNSEGKTSSDTIDFFDYVDERQFDKSMATVALGANDSKGLIDYATAWRIENIPPNREIIISGKIGLVTTA